MFRLLLLASLVDLFRLPKWLLQIPCSRSHFKDYLCFLLLVFRLLTQTNFIRFLHPLQIQLDQVRLYPLILLFHQFKLAQSPDLLHEFKDHPLFHSLLDLLVIRG